jgi:xylan 1,4-beta-xylosidase
LSSHRPGHDAAYALDDSNGTWWEPAADDAQPSLTVDLGSITQFETEQAFTVDSSRIEFLARGGGGRGAAPAPIHGATAFRYKIEVSTDGKAYSTVLDKTSNNVTRYTEFDEIPPVRCRYVRLTLTDWPRAGDLPLGVVEFTIFGKAAEPQSR